MRRSTSTVHARALPPSLLLTRSRTASLLPPSPLPILRSSGFLAFGGHCGFLQAVLDADLEVAGVMGTSSGALVGSLFAAGLTPLEILAEFASTKPIERIRLNSSPWRGIFNLSPAVERWVLISSDVRAPSPTISLALRASLVRQAIAPGARRFRGPRDAVGGGRRVGQRAAIRSHQ